MAKFGKKLNSRLNEATTDPLSGNNFNLLFEKFKVKRKKEVQLSGVAVEDSELDTAMEEIMEKCLEAEAQDASCNASNKKKIEIDRASGEEVRKKACEKLGETLKRKLEEEGAEKKSKKSRRYGRIP